MNKPPGSQRRNKDGADRPEPKDRRLPVDPDRAPDEAVEGRDRLSENEGRRMDPGISDSSHS